MKYYNTRYHNTCEIDVKPEDIKNYSHDTWIFARDGGRSKNWDVCMNLDEYYFGLSRCYSCRNDYFDALLICHAEKGTKIGNIHL